MFRLNRLPAAIAAFLLIACAAASARAELRIDMTRGTVQPMPIAIPPFPGRSRNDAQSGADIAGVIAADLERSGLFRRSTSSFIQTSDSRETAALCRLAAINAQALVTGTVQPQGDGRLRVEFRLWDVFAEQQLVGFAFTTHPAELARASRISSPTRSTSGSPARTAISTPASSISPRSGPAQQPRQASGHHGPGRRQPSAT